MNDLEPINQQKLFGLDKYLIELIRLYESDIYPSKILISGEKGIGKSTLAYHFINYVLSKKENFQYDIKNFSINPESSVFKTILNKTNTNLSTIDVNIDKKTIDIKQIRDLVVNLNKSSFNKKPRFVLIDNIEFLNTNSINALLKVLEEPNKNIYFILINSNKKILSTLLSRCINFKINLTNKECIDITNLLLNERLENLINKKLLNYYLTPGVIYNLIRFSKLNGYNLYDLDLKSLIKTIIKDNIYKKNSFMKHMVFQLIEFYFLILNTSFSKNISDKYSYFIKKASDTKKFNLDEESFFIELEDEILNG